ncbi:MAG: FAD-binding oxidoreductase [Pseudomonadales bacterium]|nr:FAD-binding oxidoreductase [Pseudomonadales bacterium]MBP9032891.1 FAD-binding oxidoreductase [Pseudomonadales bacterium]
MQQLISALQEVLGPGGVLTGEAARSRSGSWGVMHCDAPAVLRPQSTQDVAAILRLCHAAGQPVVTEGGKTGLVSGARAAASELALSLERMHAIERLDARGRTMTVQAGATLQAVHEAAEAEGLVMPLDLGARGTATIGGNIATNAGGNQVIRYGMMREQVLGLEVVLADGTVLSSLNQVLKNNTGYDLKQLFIGSEGTLGVITRAVLRLRPLMPARNSALVASDSLEHVIALLTFIERELGGRMSAFEAMWNNFYRIASRGPHLGQPPIADSYPFYVLIESAGADLEAEAGHFLDALTRATDLGLLQDAVLAQSERERAAFWAIRDNIESLAALWPLAIFDISLPLASMEDYLERTGARLQQRLGTLRWITFGHLGDSNLHLAVALDGDDPAARHAVEEIVYGGLAGIGGSVSAEHGIGLEKREFLHCSRSDAEIELMKTLKRALDSRNILNPGRIFRL